MVTRLKRYLAILGLLGIGGWLAAHGWTELRSAQRLSREGRPTEGKVLDHSTSYRYKRGTRYHLTVEYVPENHAAILKRFTVESGVYHRSVESGTVQVRYLPENPEVSFAGDQVSVSYSTPLIGAGMFLSGLYLVWFFRHARKQVEHLCEAEHQFETVDASQYRELDYAFYEEGRLVLETHGYRFLADREDLTFRRQHGLRIPLRLLLSRDGGTVAALYHLRQRWYLRALGVKDSKVIDLQTRFTNGEWLLTSNAQAAGALDQPPGVDGIYLTADTFLETVIESHTKRVAVYLAKQIDVHPVVSATLEDVDRLNAELDRRKADHRRHQGLSQEELQRIAGTSASPALTILHDGINAGRAQQPASAPEIDRSKAA
jgi:hypothetical protein